MHFADIHTHCMAKRGVEETFPFDERTLVFKAGGKMFALIDVEGAESINLKCDPERALELRETYAGILPGYHMNKTHWNTVKLKEDVPPELVFELIDHSYELVVASLPKKIRNELQDR